MSDDWDHVTVMHKKRTTQQNRSNGVLNSARRSGKEIETTQKYGAGTNKKHQTDKNVMMLDNDNESTKVTKVEMSVGKTIMQARNALGMSQKDLSVKIQEKPNVVNDYEAGRAVPNQQIFGKLERALGIKLRGKNIGQPLQKPGKK